jgi:II/X family phage/plasmid replication protein
MTSMIDWVTAQVACDYSGAINGGQVLTVDTDGTVEHTKDRWAVVEGSYSSKFVVRGDDDPTVFGCRLYISGNPSKFLQGHNLFGSGDLNYLVSRTMEVIADRLGLPASANDRASWRMGAYFVHRVDVTRMYDVGTPERVNDWLVSAARVIHSRYQPAGNDHGSTIYVGKNSRRVSLKFYDKGRELQVRGHALPDTLPIDWHRRLTQFSVGKLRVEATFRSMWLNDNGRAVGLAWSPEVAENLLQERLEAIEMSDTMRMSDEYIGELPGKVALVYEAWRAGRDLRTMFSKSAFYRYRSELLKHGIDIAHVRPREVVLENQYLLGAPLKSFLAGPGVPVPEWAKDTPMYASA